MANKQGFKNIDSNNYVYQEQTTSAAIGIDLNENNLLKIVAQSTPGANPTSAGGVPTVGASGIFLDGGQSTGDITIVPEASGNLVALNVFEFTGGAANSGVMVIDEDGIIGSTLDTVDGTVLIGQSTGQPIFSDSPSVTKISISNAPVDPTDGTNKAYVDAIAGGFTFIDEVLLGTTGALTATYANGAAGVGATLTNSGTQVALSIDGVATAPGDRILVKDQVSQLENGIYTVTDIGSGATNWVLTRATDYDQAAEINPGDIVPVTSGTVNANTTWLQTRVVTTVGTDPIVFLQFTHSDSAFLLKAANLSDVDNVSDSRDNLGLTECAISTTVNHAVQVGNTTNGLNSISVGTTGQVLTGSTGANPAFANIGTNSNLTNHGVLVGQGNSAFVATAVGINGQVLKGVTASDPQWGQVNLTTDVTGTLPVANGGTGDATFTAFAVVAGGTTGTGALQSVSGLGTSGQVLTSNGAGTLPTWQNGGGGGGGGTTITAYGTPGSFVFTPQSSTKIVEVFGWSGGGGGGAFPNRCGGGSGSTMHFKILKSLLPASVNLVVGAGGAGGQLNVDQGKGGNGEISSFGNMYAGVLGNFPNGAGQGNSGPGYNGICFDSDNFMPTNTGSLSSQLFTIAGLTSNNNQNCCDVYMGSLVGTGGGAAETGPPGPTGPGAGGNITRCVKFNGTFAVTFLSVPVVLAGGTPGTSLSQNGGNGNDAFTISMGIPTSTLGFWCGGSGGGGGFIVALGSGGVGGNGGFPGGGGGGSEVTGGNGGDGCVIVIEYA
jgi:hypothetical protein